MLYFLIKIKWTKDEIDEVQILTYNENEGSFQVGNSEEVKEKCTVQVHLLIIKFELLKVEKG